jgi:hypothetical protein
MLQDLRVRQALAIVVLRLRLVLLGTVALLVVHGVLRHGSVLSRRSRRRWTWSDARQESLEIVGGGHFCQLAAMRGDLPSDVQALSFSRELSFESKKGEVRK